MKKGIVAAAVSVMALISMGCASAPVHLETLGPVAFMCLSSNVNVPYETGEVRDDEYGTEDGMVSNAMNRWLGKDNPEIILGPDRLTYANEQFVRALEENAGIATIDKETVFDSEVYQSIGGSLLEFADVRLRCEGYKNIDYLGSKKARMFCKQTGAKSMIYVNFTFKKEIRKGHKLKGEVGALAKMNIVVFDENNNEVINDDFELRSAKTVEIDMLDYDKDEIADMFPELIDILINQFIVKYM